MEYRQLPHGTEQERFSVLGLGMGGIQNAPEGEIEQVVRIAVDHGINAEETGGDLFQIITEQKYPVAYRDTTDLAKEEQNNDERPALASHVENMGQYDVIFLGFPNWWGTLPQAVVTFLEEYDFTGKTIVPFCSHEGSGLGRGPRDIAALCPGAELLDGLAVRDSAVSGARADVQEWLDNLNLD